MLTFLGFRMIGKSMMPPNVLMLQVSGVSEDQVDYMEMLLLASCIWRARVISQISKLFDRGCRV